MGTSKTLTSEVYRSCPESQGTGCPGDFGLLNVGQQTVEPQFSRFLRQLGFHIGFGSFLGFPGCRGGRGARYSTILKFSCRSALMTFNLTTKIGREQHRTGYPGARTGSLTECDWRSGYQIVTIYRTTQAGVCPTSAWNGNVVGNR